MKVYLSSNPVEGKPCLFLSFEITVVEWLPPSWDNRLHPRGIKCKATKHLTEGLLPCFLLMTSTVLFFLVSFREKQFNHRRRAYLLCDSVHSIYTGLSVDLFGLGLTRARGAKVIQPSSTSTRGLTNQRTRYKSQRLRIYRGRTLATDCP